MKLSEKNFNFYLCYSCNLLSLNLIFSENVADDQHVNECDEELGIQFLIKKPHSKCIFYNSDRPETCRVSRSKILKILLDPVQNRRGGLVFKDKSILEYVL